VALGVVGSNPIARPRERRRRYPAALMFLARGLRGLKGRMRRWLCIGVWAIGWLGCASPQPVRPGLAPLAVLERQLPPPAPEAAPAVSPAPPAEQPDSAIAGVPVPRRIPTLREAMEQLLSEQTQTREAVEEVGIELQQMRLLLGELAQMLEGALQLQSHPQVQERSRQRRSAARASVRPLRTRRPSPSVPDSAGAHVAEQPRTPSSPTQAPAAPSAPQREYVRALQHIARQEYAEALELLAPLAARAGDPTLQSNARYWRGEILFRQGKYAEALAELHPVAETNTPKAAAAQALIAEIYLRQGERQKARAAFQSLLQRFPNSEFVVRARKMLQQL
jgi:TolA-binding protein